jgi:hypothetical protein
MMIPICRNLFYIYIYMFFYKKIIFIPNLSQYEIIFVISFVRLLTIDSNDISLLGPTKSDDSRPPYTKMQFLFL